LWRSIRCFFVAIAAGDQLETAGFTRTLLMARPGIDAVASTIPENNSAKFLPRRVSEGWAAIGQSSHRLPAGVEWSPVENERFGIVAHARWFGTVIHHFAIEPTNANDDSLAVQPPGNHCGTVAGKQFSLMAAFPAGSDFDFRR